MNMKLKQPWIVCIEPVKCVVKLQPRTLFSFDKCHIANSYTGVSKMVASGSSSGLMGGVGESSGFSAMGVIFPVIPPSSTVFLVSETSCDGFRSELLLLLLALRLVTVLVDVVLIMLLRFDEIPDASVSADTAE